MTTLCVTSCATALIPGANNTMEFPMNRRLIAFFPAIALTLAACNGSPSDENWNETYEGSITLSSESPVVLNLGASPGGNAALVNGAATLNFSSERQYGDSNQVTSHETTLSIVQADKEFSFTLPDLTSLRGTQLFYSATVTGQTLPLIATTDEEVLIDTSTRTERRICRVENCSQTVNNPCEGRRNYVVSGRKLRRTLHASLGTPASTANAFNAVARFDGNYDFWQHSESAVGLCE